MADTGYINNSGVQDILATWLGTATPSKMASGKVYLFSNNVTLSDSTSLGALTESSFPGYAAITLSGSSWNAVTVTANVASSAAVSAFTFTCTGGGSSQQAYGAYITDSASSVLLACWTFASGPFTMVNNGDKIQTTPTFLDQSLN